MSKLVIDNTNERQSLEHVAIEFQSKYSALEEEAIRWVDGRQADVLNRKPDSFFNTSFDGISNDYGVFLIDSTEELLFWNNNTIEINFPLDVQPQNSKVLVLKNGYYLAYTKIFENTGNTLLLLHPIYYKYNFNNNYIKNKFHSHWQLENIYNIKIGGIKPGEVITNQNHEEVATLIERNNRLAVQQSKLAELLYALSLIFAVGFLFLLFGRFMRRFTLKSVLATLGFLTSLIGVFYFYVHLDVLEVVSNLSIFSPHYYASRIAPSMGHLLLASALIYVLAIFCFYFFRFTPKQFSVNQKNDAVHCGRRLFICIHAVDIKSNPIAHHRFQYSI